MLISSNGRDWKFPVMLRVVLLCWYHTCVKHFRSIYQEKLASLQPWEIKRKCFASFTVMFVGLWIFLPFAQSHFLNCFPVLLSEYSELTSPTVWVIYTAVNEEGKKCILKQ